MLFVVLLCTIALGAGPRTEKAVKDRVTSLPGQPANYNANMFAGYISITNGSIFYMYVEAMENPDTAPLLWWTNGGPGCSGFNGFMEEQGPFRPNKEGTLDLNPYAWNQKVNMVYVEQPVGVGFSSTEGRRIKYSDSQAAADNHEFFEGFFDTFPDLQTRDFYLSSESYGGHYLPTLAKALVDDPLSNNPNFKGFLVGNPLTNMANRDQGEFLTLAGHNVLPKPLVDQWLEYNCTFDQSSSKCVGLEDKYYEIMDTLDPYALDYPLCVESSVVGEGLQYEAHIFQSFINRHRHTKGDYFPTNYEPCLDSYTTTYMNRDDVKKALNADVSTDWEVCNGAINSLWDRDQENEGMEPIYQYLLNNSDLKIMIYSGDNDAVCATAGTQLFLWDMNWFPTTYWEPWYTNGQMSGFVTEFSNGFTFKTVHGAGHMVPATRPEQALDLLHTFLGIA